MRQKHALNRDSATELSLNFVRFLALDEERFARFQQLTGLDQDAVMNQLKSRDENFLGQILDYALGDESLLLEFAAGEGLDPTVIAIARSKLPGFWQDG
jgi:Protein of unknown function (DUF3572)